MNFKRTLLTTLTALALTSSLHARDTSDAFSIEIDPATYVFSGYAIHFKKSFKALPNFQFGVGAYAMDFPDILVNLEADNANKGWEQRLDQGFGFFVDYFFEKNQKGLFTGLQLASQSYEITLTSDTATYGTFLAMPYIGYQYDINDNFYVKPWIGVGYSTQVSGSNVANGTTFVVPSIIVFPTVHLGYKF